MDGLGGRQTCYDDTSFWHVGWLGELGVVFWFYLEGDDGVSSRVSGATVHMARVYIPRI